MSTDTNNRGAGPPAAGAPGSAGRTDASATQQGVPYADASMASVVNQMAALGLNAGAPSMPTGYHGMPMAQHTNVYPPPFYGHTAQTPGYMLPESNGTIFVSNGTKWPITEMSNTAAYVEQLNSFQYHLNQIPKAQREQLVRYYESLGIQGLRHDLPPLENRRSSYSTNESTPATPFYGSTASRDTGAHVTVFDHGSSAYNTPSPPQITSTGLIPQSKGFSPIPAPVPAPINRELQQLLVREPVIPQAVPAVFTPRENMKTLEQSLTNSIPGNRNVYIRGLHPTTDDDLLLAYTDRFGNVETSKAIIDTATGACKGFGFAKFKTVRESEDCIRGFYAMGYEVGFARVGDFVPSTGPLKPSPFDPEWLASANASAKESGPMTPALPSPDSLSRDVPRAVKMCNCICELHCDMFTNFDPWDQESFNSRLKAEGDNGSTNLYISNLPLNVGETELNTIFADYTILSAKVLRDSVGASRGVGFARFESRDVCDEIIHHYTGQPLGDEGLPMQIRYADTPAQKELKRVTSERRQFRTNEYNVGAYGTPLVGMSPTIYSQPAWKQRGISNGSTPFSRSSLSQLRDMRAGADRLSSITAASVETPAAEDGSGDECATIEVDSPLVANGSTQSSPIKKEKN